LSARIPLPFVTAFRFLPVRPKTEDQRPPTVKITFCVRGVGSPLLANVYLHFVFDLWAKAWRRKRARGDMIVVRFAGDIVLGFQVKADADQFRADLAERMRK